MRNILLLVGGNNGAFGLKQHEITGINKADLNEQLINPQLAKV